MATYTLQSERLSQLILEEEQYKQRSEVKSSWPAFSHKIERELLELSEAKRSDSCRRHYVQARIYEDIFRVLVRLPGMALAVYQVLHYRRATTRRENITVTNQLLQRWGIMSRHTKRRALNALASVGLIEIVATGHGRNPVVRLLSQQPTANEVAEDADEDA